MITKTVFYTYKQQSCYYVVDYIQAINKMEDDGWAVKTWHFTSTGVYVVFKREAEKLVDDVHGWDVPVGGTD